MANGKGAAGSNDEDDGQATPSKKRAAKGKGKGTPRGKKAKEEVNEEDGYGGESGESPGKRMKMEEDTELADEDAYSGA